MNQKPFGKFQIKNFWSVWLVYLTSDPSGLLLVHYSTATRNEPAPTNSSGDGLSCLNKMMTFTDLDDDVDQIVHTVIDHEFIPAPTKDIIKWFSFSH